MGTAIVVTLVVLLAVGIVTDQLFRLKKWLNKSTPNNEEPDSDFGPTHEDHPMLKRTLIPATLAGTEA